MPIGRDMFLDLIYMVEFLAMVTCNMAGKFSLK
jgi:hypothetical protein